MADKKRKTSQNKITGSPKKQKETQKNKKIQEQERKNTTARSKKTRKSSIKTWLFTPLLILAVLAVITNVISIINLRNVNSKATTISDKYLTGITVLSELKSGAMNIHNMALSHIVATDALTMIELVSSINASEKELDGTFESFRQYLGEADKKEYDVLIGNYDGFKQNIANMLALSANNNKEDAFEVANVNLKNYSDNLYSKADSLINSSKTASNDAKKELQDVYKVSFVINVVSILICALSMIIAVFVVLMKIIRPITNGERELTAIIKDIDERHGDLTKRITIYSNDEIAALGKGINSFIEKLQSIFGMVSEISNKMDKITGEISERIITSNGSVTDLSAFTEELSATMSEVGNNSFTINDNVSSVNEEVNTIAEKTVEINSYSKQMKAHAEKMENTARTNMDTTMTKVSQILAVLNKAIEDSKSIDQINNLTDNILNISEQTTLLALNASIEAARAGEAGKGFAVVASEINHLADESSNTANHIQTINSVIVEAVHNLAFHANDLIDYLNNSILHDFEDFVKAGGEYKQNATYIENVMEQFTMRTDALKNSVSEIANSMDSISTAIDEGTNGVASTADSVQELATDIENISKEIEDNREIASTLKKETEVFVNL